MKTRHLIGMLGAAIMAALLSPILAPAVEKAGDVVQVRGKAVIERKAGSVDAKVAAALQESDSVMTRDKARVKMLFRDDSILTLGANSKLVIKKYLYSSESKRAESIYELADGRLRSVVGSPGFKVTTPTAFAAARGTVFTVAYHPDTNTTEIIVTEGSAEVRNINAEVAGTQIVTAGHSTTVTGNKPPTAPKAADPKSARVGDDKGGLSSHGEHGVGDNVFGELHDLGEKRDRLNKPFEQEPSHGSTKTYLNVQFPR